MQSVTPNTTKPAAASAHVRVSRQPESAIAATTRARSTVSPIGYARLTATATGRPSVALSTASNASAAATAATVDAAMAPSIQTLSEARGSRARKTSASPA